ncbi:hypothetical protein BVRB_9g210960 isoform A [Beta vulgaris subsp. vulgaris]|nr:hypothetical protein BVRB_9g210960 isoform A [Beta vulgaris subsp. vulgaris]
MDGNTNTTFLAIAITLCTIILVYIRCVRERKRSALPPSPPRFPIIGHLHLLTDMPHHSLFNLAKQHGPILYLQLGQVPTVVISSADLAKEILKVHDHVFCNRPQIIAAQYLSFGCSDVTFSSYGPYWRQARKICVTELLAPRRVNSFQLVRVEELTRLLSTVSAQSGSEVDVSKAFFGLANDMLCRVAFGKRFISESTRGVGKNLVDVLTETQELLAGFCVGDFYPSWGWVNSVSGFKRRLERNLEDLRRVCDEIIEEHIKKERRENEGEDFVDVLLRVQKQENLEVPITDDNLKALVLDMFVAGTDTTSSTLEWTMTELARHPEVMKKAQEEVRSMSSQTGHVDDSHLQHFHYLKAVIKETMRLHPTVPLLVPRESMERCVIDGYEIPPKTRVLINTFSIGRDPKSWYNPLHYNPERFMEGDLKMIDFKGQDFRFLPFGGGRRGCPGYSFGLATVELALAQMLYHFDWKLPYGVQAEKMDLTELFGLATRKKTPLVLVPTVNEAHPFKGSNDQT